MSAFLTLTPAAPSRRPGNSHRLASVRRGARRSPTNRSRNSLKVFRGAIAKARSGRSDPPRADQRTAACLMANTWGDQDAFARHGLEHHGRARSPSRSRCPARNFSSCICSKQLDDQIFAGAARCPRREGCSPGREELAGARHRARGAGARAGASTTGLRAATCGRFGDRRRHGLHRRRVGLRRDLHSGEHGAYGGRRKWVRVVPLHDDGLRLARRRRPSLRRPARVTAGAPAKASWAGNDEGAGRRDPRN